MRDTLQRIGFPEEAICFFESLSSALTKDDHLLLDDLQSRYFLHDLASMPDMTPHDINVKTDQELSVWAEKKKISPYSAKMLFLIRCLPELHDIYHEKGYSDDMYYGICSDLTNKLLECKKMHDVYGTFVFYWFHRHFTAELFALGRFQYEVRHMDHESDVDIGFFRLEDGSVQLSPLTEYNSKDPSLFYVLRKGQAVYNFHIPSCGPMPLQARLDSYRKAYEFFGYAERNEPIPLVCVSWLLWPENSHLFPEGSNLLGFFHDFQIIRQYDPKPEHPFSDAWRVFYADYNGDTSLFSRKTSLQKSLAEHLDKGGVIGSGFGVILFDGEKIISQ